MSVLSYGSWVTFDTQMADDPALECMQAAHDAASEGDQLVLTDGTYLASSSTRDLCSSELCGSFATGYYAVLELSKGINIRALNPGQAVLDGQDARRVLYVASGTVRLGSFDSSP